MADHAPTRDFHARPDRRPPARNAEPELRTGVRVTTTAAGGLVAAVELHGELCAATAPILAMELERLMRDGVTQLTIDVTHLSLCTSDGLDLWAHVHDRLRDRNATGVEISGARGVVRRVLQIVCDADPSFDPIVIDAFAGSDRPARLRRGDSRG